MGTVDLGDPAVLLGTVAEQLGLTLVSWRATHSEPAKRGNLLGFEAQLESADGQRQTQTIFVETEPPAEHRDNVLVLEQPEEGTRVAVWVYPNDPALPALAATVFTDSAAALLARLGVTVSSPELSVLAYRPGKRAVIRVDGGAERIYLKVVRPGKAEAIVGTHRSLLEADIEVPRVLGWSEEGLIALTELQGVEAQKVVTQLDESFLDRVSQLVAHLSTVTLTEPARESLVDRLAWYRDRLAAAHPEQKQRFSDLADGIRQLLSEGRSKEVALVTIHGDLHAGQIFVQAAPDAPAHAESGHAITGLLDIDTAGIGDPADDAAAFYAHLLVLAHHLDSAHETAAARHAAHLAEHWRRGWVRDGDAGFSTRARAISATHFLGHALRQSTPAGVEAMIQLAEGVGSGDVAS